LVEPDHLRFDFTHFAAMTQEEIQKVNEIVNSQILNGLSVSVSESTLDEARSAGAMALFGEKYGASVRTVRMGTYSFELCGGTHLSNTALAGSFDFRTEASVSTGVRRIEAVTGLGVLQQLRKMREIVYDASATLKTSPGDLQSRIIATLNQSRELQRDLSQYKEQVLSAQAEQKVQTATHVGPIRYLCWTLPATDTDSLKVIGDTLKDKHPDLCALLVSSDSEKVTFLASSGKQAVAAGAHAGNLIRFVSQATGGSGGGKPDLAMGGGKDIQKLAGALEQGQEFLKSAVHE
jgi:alanyl-tRNA synthetase